MKNFIGILAIAMFLVGIIGLIGTAGAFDQGIISEGRELTQGLVFVSMMFAGGFIMKGLDNNND